MVALGCLDSMYGKVCARRCSPSSSESHWVKLRAFSARGRHAHQARGRRWSFCPPRCPWRRWCCGCSCPGGSSWCRCPPAGRGGSAPPSRTRRTELSPRSTTDGYFQVIAEPVSTWVHAILALSWAIAALGHEVVDAALAVLVAGVPVLHRGIFDLGAVEGHQLDHRARAAGSRRACGAVQPSR